MFTDDTIIFKEPIYISIFECGKNLLNKLDLTCIATQREKYI